MKSLRVFPVLVALARAAQLRPSKRSIFRAVGSTPSRQRTFTSYHSGRPSPS